MTAGTQAARTLGKSAYFFSIVEAGKVQHLNYVLKDQITPEFSAKIWIGAIATILGGKVRYASF